MRRGGWGHASIFSEMLNVAPDRLLQQKMATPFLLRDSRMNIDILGLSELRWTGMGEFNSDDHYIC